MIETTIVCPFCPLACDDVRVIATEKPGHLPMVQTTCELATKLFRDAMQPAPPRIANKTASLTEIREHLRDSVAQSKRIVVKTGGVDLASAKALEQLSSHGKITWVIDQSPVTRSWQLTSSRDGVISATLGDVREHADLLWLIGSVESAAPRIKEVLIENKPSLQVIQTPGPLDLDTLASLALATRDSITIHAKPVIAKLAEAIESSKYFAVVCGDDAFDSKFADAGLCLLIQWVWSLNAKRRAVAMHLDDAATNRAVYRWRTNRSLANVCESESGPNSLTVRIGASVFDPTPVNIAIGTCDPGMDRAIAFIPCSIVGVHESGARIRGDGTVTMPLAKITHSDLPTATAWIESLSA